MNHCKLLLSCLIVIVITGSSHAESSVKSPPPSGFLSALPETQRKLVRFFTGGITQLLWDQMKDVSHVKLNGVCERSLLQTVEHLEKGTEWAFRIIDSSSKSPAGLLDGTVSSFGDYDQCLEVETKDVRPKFFGKHCMLTLRPNPEGLGQLNISKYLQQRLPVFNYYHLNIGLCLPSTCRPGDIEKLLKNRLDDQPFIFNGDITCDTASSTSYTSRLMNLTWAQIGALIYLLGIVALVQLGTHYHLFDFAFKLIADRRIEDYVPIRALNDQMYNFSFFENIKRLITVKRGQENLTSMDKIKIGIVFLGVICNCASCFETPLGLYVIHRIHDTSSVFSSLLLQPLFNLNTMNLLSFIGGAMTLLSTYDLIYEERFNFSAAVFLRWFKYAPAVAAVLAFDFIWPLLGDGPMYTRMSKLLLHKCSSNWWGNIFMLGNLKPSIENCSPHTFYLSVDLQLFVLGLFAVYLLSRNAIIGSIFASGLALFGNYLLFINSKNLTSPVFLDKSTSVDSTMSYVDTAIVPTYSHLPDYFIGIQVAFLLKQRILSNDYFKKSLLVSVTITLLQLVLTFSPALHNIYGKVPQQYYAHFVVLSKMSYTFLFATMFLNLYTEDNQDESGSQEGSDHDDQATVVSASKAMAKLSFAAYLINYFFIRYDFFSTRLLYVIDFYNIVKRVIYTIFYTLLLSLIFHLNFLSPLENVRKSFGLSLEKRPIAKDKDD